MSRTLILPLLLLSLCLPVFGQSLGDQSSAGFSNARTYTNNDVSGLRPPLRLFETVNLAGVTDANTLAVFENKFLVQQQGSPVTYRLFNRTGGAAVWTQTVFGSGSSFRYVPALGGSIVILGGEGTTSVKAVRISDGSVLWGDAVGNTDFRFPAVTDNLAVYAGNEKIVARGLAGALFWQEAVTTARAAVAVRDDSLYFLTRDRKLRAVNLMSGADKWPAVTGVAGDAANLIATEKYVFVNDPDGNKILAFNAVTGQPVWNKVLTGKPLGGPGILLAYGRLYVLRSQEDDTEATSKAAITAYDANTGEEIWTVRDPKVGIGLPFIADNTLYYTLNVDEIRARDAATGALIWSIPKSDVRYLTGANGELLVLGKDKIDIYRRTNEIFMPQMANGAGQTTLIMLANTSSEAATAEVEFYEEDGDPVAVPVRTFGTQNKVQVTIPPSSSIGIQTEDKGGNLIVGYVRVLSTQPIHGTTNFQYSEDQEILREAGVADALATGFANIFVNVSGSFNAGVAMVNPTEQDTSVTLRLLNNAGIELASKTFDLDSGAHLAQFITELFPDDVGTAFEGTLVIEAQAPIATTAIRTKGGIQISSYPVGQAVR